MTNGTAYQKRRAKVKQMAKQTTSKAGSSSNSIDGHITSIDSFGNLSTNITQKMLDAIPSDATITTTCEEHQTFGIFANYADQPAQTLIALVRSGNELELAIVNGTAAEMLGVNIGDKVVITW